MSGFFRRLFSPGPVSRSIRDGYDVNGDPVPRSVGKNAMLAAGYGKDAPKLRKFKLEGKVIKDSQAGFETLASGGCIKEAVSADALKAEWEADMKRAFPQGPDYNVEYHCVVEPVEDEPDDSDEVAAATAAAVAATTMF